jgi:WD40 repeat protein
VTGHIDWVYAVAISADGTWLATAGHDRTVRLHDAATGEQRRTLTGPDGSWLATASHDHTVRLYDAAAGAVATMMRTEGRCRACAWTPDGRALAVGTDLGLDMFDFEPGQDDAARPAPQTRTQV